MHWAQICDEALLANAGKFTVSCGVLNLIPVLALRAKSGAYCIRRMLMTVSSRPLSKKIESRRR
jgi:membrane-associated protease RseP (regulator of RpoE activity)